jgi:hypothetical protein
MEEKIKLILRPTKFVIKELEKIEKIGDIINSIKEPINWNEENTYWFILGRLFKKLSSKWIKKLKKEKYIKIELDREILDYLNDELIDLELIIRYVLLVVVIIISLTLLSLL